MSSFNAFIFLQVHSGQLLYQIWHHPFPGQHRITTKCHPSQVASVSWSSTLWHQQILILHCSPRMKWDVASWRWDWCFSWWFFRGPQPYGPQTALDSKYTYLKKVFHAQVYSICGVLFLCIIIEITFVLVCSNECYGYRGISLTLSAVIVEWKHTNVIVLNHNVQTHFLYRGFFNRHDFPLKLLISVKFLFYLCHIFI